MKSSKTIVTYALAGLVIIFIGSCNNLSGNQSDLTDTLEPVEDVSLISGADNATITVSKNDSSYFNIELSNIASNDVIENTQLEGWCIDWQKPINSNNSNYSGIKLYSTFKVEKWKQVNYLLNIKSKLLKDNPDMTWRDIQAAIWSLRANPEFNIDKVAVKDLPSDMVENGHPKYNIDNVHQILDMIASNYGSFDFAKGTKFAIIAATPADVQTVIAVAE